MREYDLIIIGGGPAGLGAAVRAKELGIDKVLILERDIQLGGILKQCIHNGFGLHIFNEELTGPEYAKRFTDRVKELNIEYKLETMVLNINGSKEIITASRQDGICIYKAKTVILAMGCRERPRGSLRIPGANPSGIFTAGTVQRFVNMEGMLPGTSAVILGSGDIGLIMARRLTLEGIKVKVVCEIMGYPGGLTRNIVQCLDDYDIPLKLSHTVVKIHGKERVTGVTIARVDDSFNPVERTEEFVQCDTLLLSVGLIPENELTIESGAEIDSITSGAVVDQNLETSVSGIFACGNVLHVHDLVDYVTLEGYKAAESAVKFINKNEIKTGRIPVLAGEGIRYVLPQYISIPHQDNKKIRLYFRSRRIYRNVKVKATGSVKKFLRLAPSEMEYIDIAVSELADAENIVMEVIDP